MKTYRYRFPVEGELGPDNADAARLLGERLKDSPDCLGTYCIFPSDSAILDHVSFELEGKGDYSKITAVDLHTYTQPYEGTEGDFMDCVAENLTQVLPGVKLSGNMEFKGLEGDVPNVMYHITEKKNLESIVENGLVPGSGKNQYKSHDNYIYLTSGQDLAPWLAILPHMEDPVILKMESRNVEGLEQGRMFEDRPYVAGGKYTEYRTKEPISANVMAEVDPKRFAMDGYLKVALRLDMELQTGRALKENLSDDMLKETVRGLKRLEGMGMYEDYEKFMGEIRETPAFATKLDRIKMPAAEISQNNEEGLPWDENDNGKNPNEEDDFTKAVESITGTQMTLADYGIK